MTEVKTNAETDTTTEEAEETTAEIATMIEEAETDMMTEGAGIVTMTGEIAIVIVTMTDEAEETDTTTEGVAEVKREAAENIGKKRNFNSRAFG